MTTSTKTIRERKEKRPWLFLSTALFIIALSLVLQPLTAEAKGRFFGPQRTPAEIVQTLTERLDLTEEQAQEVRAVIEDKTRKQNELRGKGIGDRQAHREEMLKIRTETENRLNEILTDEQKAKHRELQNEQRKWNRGGKGRGGKMRGGFDRSPEAAIDRLTDRLNLTPEQVADITPVIQESMEKKKALFDKYAEQKFTMRNAMRSEMQAIGDETHAELSELLTDDQIATLNKLRDERGSRMNMHKGHPGRSRYW